MTKKAEEQKIYVIDTNVFMSDPDCLSTFDDNEIVVPDVVIEELDNNKKESGDKGYNTRQALRNFDALRSKGNLIKGIPTENGGIIRIQSEYGTVKLPETWADKPDNYIIKIAKYLSETETKPVIIVSKDTNVRIKADIIGVKAEDYRHEMIDEDYLLYNGRTKITISPNSYKIISQGTPIEFLSTTVDDNGQKLIENEFVQMVNCETQETTLGRVKDRMIVPLMSRNVHPFDVCPRNLGQIYCIEALLAPAEDIPLVILKGSAGTAKTFLTLACALQQCAEDKIYRKITISRANVEFDHDIGALPGDEESKVGPLLRGCMDNLEQLVDSNSVKIPGSSENDIKEKVNYLFDKGYISAEALSFLRGRSLTRQILYVDEAQNTSPSQMKGILTRIGEGTKLVIAGDLNQIDTPRLDKRNNGLAYAIKLIAGDPLCCVVGFTDAETTRSALAARVAALIR